MYFKKKQNTFIIDSPIKYSTLAKMNLDKKEVAKLLCDKANNLAATELKDNFKK